MSYTRQLTKAAAAAMWRGRVYLSDVSPAHPPAGWAAVIFRVYQAAAPADRRLMRALWAAPPGAAMGRHRYLAAAVECHSSVSALYTRRAALLLEVGVAALLEGLISPADLMSTGDAGGPVYCLPGVPEATTQSADQRGAAGQPATHPRGPGQLAAGGQ